MAARDKVRVKRIYDEPTPGDGYRVLVDRRLLSHKRVWIGAGSPRHMAVIAPGDLVRLSRAQAMDVVEPAT